MTEQRSWPTIIVPIHNGAEVLAPCLAALAAHTPAGACVLLADDASDCPRTQALIETWNAGPSIEVRRLRHPRNLGFVGNANAAMAATNGDVVLLNSDTRVTPGWLQALMRCADSAADVASVTPWSNNAEICSLPRFVRAAPIPKDPDAIALALAELEPKYPELPTAVGFCMFLRRACLEAIGDFDAATFGRGYGEENDWCCRASAHGWRHLLCDDAYVVHVGGASFRAVGLQPGGENLARLCARYPDYPRIIADFIRKDPLADARAAALAVLAAAGLQPPEPDEY